MEDVRGLGETWDQAIRRPRGADRGLGPASPMVRSGRKVAQLKGKARFDRTFTALVGLLADSLRRL